MTINSYFYDSVGGDRPYSAQDFARAFDIGFETGCFIRETEGGTYGFDIGGTNYTTIYEGKAVIQGIFVEIPVGSVEILTVPAGTYSGQVVIRVDSNDARAASLIVKTDRNPTQTSTVYEYVLHDVSVVNNIITAVSDKRYQGGAIPNNHNQDISTISGLQGELDKKTYWEADPNGVSLVVGKFAGTGRPIRIFFTTANPGASDKEHRVWIQIDYQV